MDRHVPVVQFCFWKQIPSQISCKSRKIRENSNIIQNLALAIFVKNGVFSPAYIITNESFLLYVEIERVEHSKTPKDCFREKSWSRDLYDWFITPKDIQSNFEFKLNTIVKLQSFVETFFLRSSDFEPKILNCHFQDMRIEYGSKLNAYKFLVQFLSMKCLRIFFFVKSINKNILTIYWKMG